MKIAIPADEKDIHSNVCISFGRTPYFIIYDTDTKESEYLDNSAAASQGGAGIKAAQSLADKSVNVLLTPRCGENAVEVLQSAGIKMYKTISETIDLNIKAYLDGSLSVLEVIHTGFNNNGNK